MKAEAQGGGFYGWWLLFFLWIVYTIPIGFGFYSPAVLYPYMIEELGWSRGEIMMGFTAMTLLMGIGAPLAAWMLGRFGARVTIFSGGVITAAATFAMGLVGDAYPIYVALSLFIGLGVALASIIPVQTVVIAWFDARRAMALGLVLGGGAIGGFLAPQLINAAVLSIGGEWRMGWFIISLASIIGAVVAMLAVRNQPSDMGQYPDGISPEQPKTGEAGTRWAPRTYRTTANWTVHDAMRTPTLWFLVAAVVGTFFLWHVVLSQGPLHLKDRGFDPAMTAFLYSLAIGLSVAGRFTVAALGDIIEPRTLFSAGALCVLVGGILFWFVSPDVMWAAYLYPLLAGFGFGAAYICIPTMIGNYWGPEAFAGINGLISPLLMVFNAIAAPLAGFLYDLQGSYFSILLAAWIATAIGFTAMLLCRPPSPKEKGMK